jgi:hypothetical protein
MASFLVCPICGGKAECRGPHDAISLDVTSVTIPCPLKKGAIYVFVKDDRGKGVEDVQVTCKGTPTSDSEGFAFFDPLEDGRSYLTSIDLTLTPTIASKYYVFSQSKISAPVTAGRITLVEFQLNRYVPLKVAVRRSDKKQIYVKDVPINVSTLTPEAAPPKPDANSMDTGPVVFDGLKQTTYKAVIQLTGTLHEDYTIDGKSEDQCAVTANKENLLEFLLLPAAWIRFKVCDEGDRALNGPVKLHLQQAGEEKKETPAENDGTAYVDKLEPGSKVNVLSVEVAERYELISLT